MKPPSCITCLPDRRSLGAPGGAGLKEGQAVLLCLTFARRFMYLLVHWAARRSKIEDRHASPFCLASARLQTKGGVTSKQQNYPALGRLHTPPSCVSTYILLRTVLYTTYLLYTPGSHPARPFIHYTWGRRAHCGHSFCASSILLSFVPFSWSRSQIRGSMDDGTWEICSGGCSPATGG